MTAFRLFMGNKRDWDRLVFLIINIFFFTVGRLGAVDNLFCGFIAVVLVLDFVRPFPCRIFNSVRGN